MNKGLKKYPLLVCLIISCVIVVTSLFISGFFGINLGVSLGGGSQFEITIPNNTNTKEYVSSIKGVLKENKITFDSATVEDKYVAGENFGEYTDQCLIIKVLGSNINDEKESQVRSQIASKLGIDVKNISSIDNIVSSIKSKDILFVGLGVGIVAICLFLFGFVRYGIFAGLSFILSFIHNIIIYLSLMILSRVPVSFVSIAAIVVLTLISSALLISIFEKYRTATNLQTAEKTRATTRMLDSSKEAVKPYIFVLVATLVFALLLFFVPVSSVMFSAISILIALAVSAYTTLLIGPGVCALLLEIQESNKKATLSRNDTVNKLIKKKIKKNTSSK